MITYAVIGKAAHAIIDPMDTDSDAGRCAKTAADMRACRATPGGVAEPSAVLDCR
jgi:hypothetical protein